jgi:hypothetical protein
VKRMKTIKSVGVLLVLAFLCVWLSTITRAEDENIVNQEIEVEVGYFILPTEEYWGCNVRFKVFIPEMPNLSKYENLMSLELRMVEYRNNGKERLFLNLTFEGSPTDAEKVVGEVLKLFNYTTLSKIYESGPVSKTNVTDFLYIFGDLPCSVETVQNFLQYKPVSGFGTLINKNFLSIYIPGNATKGITYLAYNWEKGLGWYLTIESSLNGQWSPGEKIVSLNELIGNEETIGANHGLIRVFIWNWTLGKYKYIMKPLSITPNGYTVEKEEESVTYEWRLDDFTQIQNVVIHLETSKIPKTQSNLITYLIAIVVGVIITLIVIAVVKMMRKNFYLSVLLGLISSHSFNRDSASSL